MDFYDAVIIGGGPAGLTAALYLARAKYRVLVIEKEKFGGQITITSEVVNFPGVKKTSGAELTETMRQQAESFGAEFLLDEVTELDVEGDIKKVVCQRGTIECFGILLATGAHPRMVGFSGEAEYKGHGVAYCATCDGEFFTGKEVFVVGGGFAAAEESVFLTKYASHVTILIREDDFTCAASVADPARANDKITILTNTEVVVASGDSVLRKLVYKNNKTGEETVYETDDTFGIFVFAGYAPETDLVKGVVDLNHAGYVVTDAYQATNVPGVYAAGDVCIKNLRQVVTAVGDGATAATELEKHASTMSEKTGRKAVFQEKKVQEEPKVKSETKATKQSSVFNEQVVAQLQAVFARLENPLVLKMALDKQPISNELRAYVEEMCALSDKLSWELTEGEDTPVVYVYRDGKYTGLAFHGVPGGHEFTSFVLGLYNAAGTGQAIDQSLIDRINAIDYEVNMQIMVSLTCTMCPDLVLAAQKIASINPLVSAEVYDLSRFPAMKDQYNVMSVPCFIVNDRKPNFGKKNVAQLLDIIEN